MFVIEGMSIDFQKQTEAIINLNNSEIIIMLLLEMYNADKFSEL